MEANQSQCILKALGTFDYVAATKLITKISKVYQPIGNIFTKLCSSESAFTQLQFLRSRWFVMRKDTSIEVTYSNLVLDLPREIDNVSFSSYLSNQDKNTLITLMKALIQFCIIRKDMISIYQDILAQSIKGDFDDILNHLEDIQQRTEKISLQKDLLILGLGIEKEINILTCTLRARKAITNYAFQDACISLFQAKQDLADWKRICQEQDYPEKSSSKPDDTKDTTTWRFPLFSQSESRIHHRQGDVWPNTIRWYARILGNLISKMTLYFNNILLEKESIVNDGDPQKSLWKGASTDYYELISNFKKRFNPHSINLVYQVTEDTPFYPQGYVCPDTPYEPPQGVHSFPFIFCHPKEPPYRHLPNIISIIQGSQNKLDDPKYGPFYFFDSTISSTYYLMRIDKHAVFIIIYLDKHNNREPSIMEFITNTVTLLRDSTVIEELIKAD